MRKSKPKHGNTYYIVPKTKPVFDDKGNIANAITKEEWIQCLRQSS